MVPNGVVENLNEEYVTDSAACSHTSDTAADITRNLNYLKKKKSTGAASGASAVNVQDSSEDDLEIYVGAWVEIKGLTSARGQILNGIVGEVVTLDERIGVYICEEENSVALKPSNLKIVDSSYEGDEEWD